MCSLKFMCEAGILAIIISMGVGLTSCGGGNGSASSTATQSLPPPPPPPPPPVSQSPDRADIVFAGGTNGNGADFGDQDGDTLPEYVLSGGLSLILEVTNIAPSNADVVTEVSSGDCEINGSTSTEESTLEVRASEIPTICVLRVQDATEGNRSVTVFFEDAVNLNRRYNPVNNLIFENQTTSETTSTDGCSDGLTINSLNRSSSAGVVTSEISNIHIPNEETGFDDILCFTTSTLENNDSDGDFVPTLYLVQENTNSRLIGIEGGHFGLRSRGIITVGDIVSFTNVDQVTIGGQASPGGRPFDTGFEVIQVSGQFLNQATGFALSDATVFRTHTTFQNAIDGGRGIRDIVYSNEPNGQSRMVYISNTISE